MTALLIILSLTIGLFVWGKFPPDVVALLSMISLYLFDILNLTETLSGFSNSTVIMIAALFIIGEGLSRTGWTAQAGKKFIQWSSNSTSKLLILVTLGSGFLSGFVSNTGTVATLLPVTISASWKMGTLPSKFLMPMAFGSNTGGLLTLTGTPPNIIVSNELTQQGFESFSFFEFGYIGLPLLIIALLYFRYVGYKLLPSYKTKNRPINIDSEMHDWIQNYSVDKNYFKLRIRSLSPLINTTIGEWNFENNYGVSIIRLKRRHPNTLKGIAPYIEFPDPETVMRYHDLITVKGDTNAINKLMIKFRLGLWRLDPMEEELRNNLITQEVGMAEAIITPKSLLVGRTIKLGEFLQRFDIQLLAASRNNKPLENKEIRVQAGDAFLIRGTWENIGELKNLYKNIVICGSPEGMAKDVEALTPKSYIALGSLLLMIVFLVFGWLPGPIAALISAGIILITGCVPISKAYKGISWASVIMIAAMIPMGLALQKTGAAQLAANGLVNYLGSYHPIALLGGIFLLTAGFSQTINNSATAVLMAPIAILAATTLGIDPKPLLICVAISASTAFLTPVGTTTNAMVMTAGGYRFIDYVKVGGPLLVLFFITTLLVVPLVWPF